MNVKQIEALIRLLNKNDVEYIKTPEIELRFKESRLKETSQAPQKQKPTSKPDRTTGASIPPVESEIPHHVNEVSNLLKLSDNDLVDKIFPDYTKEVS